MPNKSKLLKSFDALLAGQNNAGEHDDDDAGDGTRAALAARDSDDEGGESEQDSDKDVKRRRSGLRAKTAPQLSEIDSRYKGKKTSRKDIEKERKGGMDDEREHASAELGFMFEGGNDDDDEEEDDKEEDEEDPGSEKDEDRQVQKGFNFDSSDFEKFGSISDEEEEEDGDKEDDNDDDVEDENDVDDDDDDGAGDQMRSMAQVNVAAEVEKGGAIKRQTAVWESLLECRIQLQKVLQKANRYPRHGDFEEFTKEAEAEAESPEFAAALTASSQSVTEVLDSLLELQTTLMNANAETKSAVLRRKRELGDGGGGAEGDLEEDELCPVAKRQRSSAYAGPLQERHSAMLPHRDAVIQRWNERTRLATMGKQSSNGFSGFESQMSTVRQIEHVLADRARLVGRTQRKRSDYVVLGRKPESKESEEKGDEEGDAEEDEVDAEIFDDDDFYQQLLKELIDRKSEGVTDPVLLGRQFLKIQRARAKADRRARAVDAKASKGRKVRYDVHAKLVNFMAPVYSSRSGGTEWKEEARDELFSSLFGGNKKSQS